VQTHRSRTRWTPRSTGLLDRTGEREKELKNIIKKGKRVQTVKETQSWYLTVSTSCVQKAVLQIRDILLRLRIRGSVQQANESGSCSVCHWPSSAKKKLLFCLLLFVGTFTAFFKDKRS
jgi:hypothetical protein